MVGCWSVEEYHLHTTVAEVFESKGPIIMSRRKSKILHTRTPNQESANLMNTILEIDEPQSIIWGCEQIEHGLLV